MNFWKINIKVLLLYLIIFTTFLLIPLIASRAVTTLSGNCTDYTRIVIDAGHGGIDGGAVSCTGEYESHINLEIALKLRDIMNLLGIRTVLIRDTDRSVYTCGETVAAKKISDLNERLRIVNTTPSAILISIHQNYFTDSRYCGAQIFHTSCAESNILAGQLQDAIRQTIQPDNHRQIKRSTGIYLMEHINCAGVLIECGFLSNVQEEALLRNEVYQRNFACVIATSISKYLNT